MLDKLFGKTRAQIGASIISNFSQAEAAIKTMSESAGAADREMDIIKNSLEYKINALKETFTGIWQNIFNREDLGGLVDFATGIAEVLDGITAKLGLFGSAIAAGGIAAGVMGLANAFKAFSAASGTLTMVEALSGAFPGLSAAIGAFSTAMATTGGAAGVLHGALSGLWALIASHPIIAAVGAVALLAVAFDKLHESAKEANDKMDASFQAYEDAKQKVIDVDTELKNVQASMDALEQKGSLTFIEQSQLEDLREAAELLQIQKDLAEKEEEKAAKQAASDAVNAYKKNFKDEISKEAYDEAIAYSSWSGNNASLFADERNLSYYIAGIEKMKEFRDEEKKGSDEWNRYNDMVSEGTDNVWEQVGALTEYKQALESIPYELRTSEQNAVLDDINSSIEFVYEKLDPAKWKQIQFDSIFSHEAFKKAKQDMLDVALASDNLGISIEDVKNTLGDNLYGKLEKELSGKGFSMQDFVDNINSTAEIVDIDRVKENIKEGIETATEEAASDTDTVEPEVEVEPKITVANNAEEKAKFDEWVDGLSDDYAIALQKLMGDQTIDTSSWDTSAYQAYIESLMTGSEEAADAVSDLTGTMQDLNIVFNDSTDNGLSKSISDYKDQMNTLISARDKWNNGELSVEEMTTLQQSFVELNDFDMSNFGQGIEGAIDNVVGKFEEADTTFADFKQNIIDKDDTLKDALADISSITKKGFKDAEAGITEEYDESVNRIMDAAARAGLVNRNNRKEVDAFIDSLWESGIIQGKVGDITEKSTGLMGAFGKAIKSVGGEETIAGRALVTMRDNLLGIFNQTDKVTSAYDSLKGTLGTFTQYQTDVSAVLKASKSATGLTAEQVQTLTTAYQDLDGFNPSTLFEKTANGIHLNEEEFKRLNQEVQNSTLLQMYSDLGLKLDELHSAQARGEDTSGLEKDIADAQMLIAQYEGLTSALYAWQNAQSNGNERDSFESVAKGYEGMKNILDQGWYGDESLNAYLDLMLSASERTGDAVTDFEKLGQTIEGTDHSLKDYFTFEDGNLVSDGLFNFLDDVNAKMGDSFASIDENGNYMFDFTGEKLQQVADEFGTTTEFIQLMERAMIDAGMAVETSSSSFETMKETLDGLQSEGKISPDIDLNIDTATASIEDIEGLIQSLEAEKARIEVEADGTEETQQTLDTLDRTINTLNGQKITKSIQLAIENGNTVDELLAMDDTTLAATLNVDASEVDTARQQLEALNGATESTTVTVKLDSSQFDVLTDTSKTVTVTYSVDSPEAPTYEDQNPSVTYGITAPTAPTYKDQNPSVTYNLSAPSAPYYPNMDRYITYHIQTSGSAPSGGGGVDGTAHARGTAFANGNRSGDWGTKSSGVALGGELGEELLVRDGHFYTIGADSAEFFRYKKGDIIFNAEQTKEIFEKGKITHGSGRGEALVNGTAFDSGSGGRRRTSSSSGTSTASSVASTVTKAVSTASNVVKETASKVKKAVTESVDALQKKIDKDTKLIDKLEHIITVKEENGIAIKSSDYTKLINTVLKSSTDITKQNVKLEKKRKKSASGSSKREKYESQIESNKKTLQENENSLIKWNKALAELPITNASTATEKLANEMSILEKQLENASSATKKRSIIEKEISNVQKTYAKNQQAATKTAEALSKADKAMDSLKDSFIKNLNITDVQKQAIVNAVASGIAVDYTSYMDKLTSSQLNKLIARNEKLTAANTASQTANESREDTRTSIKEYAEQIASLFAEERDNNLEVVNSQKEVLDAQYNVLNSAEDKNANLKQQNELQRKIKNAYNSAATESTSYLQQMWNKVKAIAKQQGKSIGEELSNININVNSSTYSAIEMYNEAIEAQRTAANEAAIATAEYTESIQNNVKTMFDNIIDDYSSEQSVNQAATDRLEALQNRREAEGYSSYNAEDIQTIRDISDIYLQEYQDAIAAYNEARETFESVKNSMSKADRDDAQTSLLDLQKYADEAYTNWLQTKKILDELPIEKLSDEIDDLEAKSDQLEKTMTYNSAQGISATREEYEALISNYEMQIALREQQIEYWEEQRANTEVGSALYIEYTKQIYEAQNAILSARTEQENLNTSIVNMRADAIEECIGVLEAMKDTIYDNVSGLEELAAVFKGVVDIDTSIGAEGNIKKLTQLAINEALENARTASASVNSVYGGSSAATWYKKAYSYAPKSSGTTSTKDLSKYWTTFERAHDAAEMYLNVLKGIADLISDDMIFDKSGNLTEYGISKVGLLVKQYETAREEVENYSNDLAHLNELYKKGLYDVDEYNDKLKEIKDGMLNSAQSMKSYIEELKDLYKDLGQQELDTLFDLIDKRNEALQAKKSYYDYDKTIKNKTKDIQELTNQIAALEGINTAQAKAQLTKLKEELAEAQEDLAETQREHNLELSQSALSDLKDTMQEAFDDKWDEIGTTVESMRELLENANELTESSSKTINATLNKLLDFYGLSSSKLGVDKTFASGTKRINSRIVGLSNEKGSELLVTGNGIISHFNPGDGVVPADLTERLYNLAQNITPSIGTTPISDFVYSKPYESIGNVEIQQQYDSLITIQGSADAATVEDLKRMSKDLLEKSYNYTTKRINQDYVRTGGLRRS